MLTCARHLLLHFRWFTRTLILKICNIHSTLLHTTTKIISFYLIEIADLHVGDLLKWVTGSFNFPPLGFAKKIKCQFLHGCVPGCRCRPTTSTCDLVITLPVHLDTEQAMQEIMAAALKEDPGFGRL